MLGGGSAPFPSAFFTPDLAVAGSDAAQETHILASVVCLFGVFLRIVLPEQLLNMLGVDYSGDGGSLIAKIHPGGYFIFLALLIYLLDHGAPFHQIARTFRQYKTYTYLLLLYIALAAYWVCRDPAGVGLLFDTHMSVPICAIILSSTPRSLSRKAVAVFLLLAAVNGLAGIAESIWKFRIFTFDPTWAILQEENFRASAFLGHPLNNAMFTSVALMVALAMDYKIWTKAFLAGVLLAALVAFGGRAAFVFSVFALVPIGFVAIRKACADMTMLKMFLLIGAVILVPLFVLGGLYELLTSSIGDRLMQFSSLSDSSAHVRMLSLKVYDFMTTEDILYGVSVDKAKSITLRMGLVIPADDIENPWVLMSMYLGAIMFTVWLVMTFAFAWRLTKGRPLALQLAVLAYYVSASTSNSFGRKDSVYTIMVAAVVCAANALIPPPKPERLERAL